MNYIKHIKLKNIRGFSELNLNIANENNAARKRTVIIGKNGTCKTTLLRCIAIGLCDIEEGNSLISEPIGRLITEGKKTAEIEIELQPNDIVEKPNIINRKLKIKNGKEVVAHQDSLVPLPNRLCVFGYGAGRSTEGPEKFREYRIIDSVYTLFNYEETLHMPELILRRLRDFLGEDIYKHAMKGIKKAIGLGEKDEITFPKGGGVLISGPAIGKGIPLEGWADGFRLTFSWIMDLYAWGMKAKKISPSGGVSGILLIDELEQHIHPSMQTTMLSNLSNLLPDMQIFATTHSPLVALGASPEEIVTLKRKLKYVHSEDVVPDFTGYSAEDMLVDDRLFDTGVYSQETNQKLKQYQKLVRKNKNMRTPKDVENLKALANELRAKQIPEVLESPFEKEWREFQKKYDL